MKADPEGIPRTLKWSLSCESGDYNFNTIAQTLAEWIPPATLLDALHETAVQLIDLPEGWRREAFPNR